MLVDARNFDALKPQILAEIQAAGFLGLDIETQDSAKHEGLVAFCKAHPRELVFDQRRQVVCGLSIYAETPFYFNLNHADVENRLPWHLVQELLDARSPGCTVLCHNAPFEITVLQNTYGYRLNNVVCTLQLCASAYDPDQYDRDKFMGVGMGTIAPLWPAIYRAGMTYGGDRNHMTVEQSEVMGQVVGKSSKAAFSWNGQTWDLTYGYGLKKAVKSWFNYDMVSYEEVLGQHSHMGELTGEEVANYGCDDAEWAVRLFHRVIKFMMETNPKVISTFFNVENKMVDVYADTWIDGLKVNLEAIRERHAEQRSAYADRLRQLRQQIRALLPFPVEPNKALTQREKFYAKNPQNYRDQITAWANLPDADDETELSRIGGAMSPGVKGKLNLTYWMAIRVLLYDLIGAKIIVAKGKTQSDDEARGKVKENLTDPRHVAVLDSLNALTGMETSMKLFLTPYGQLTDPETDCLYPVLSSKLATHRMAMSRPNGMQLTKHGESRWIRGFFQADYRDHLILSIDWSGIELVEIGEFSQDPSFIAAYGQLPHKDLHAQAAATLLTTELGRTVTAEQFKSLARMTVEEACDTFGPKILTDVKGQLMTPGNAYKFHRGTDGGKGANFNYWYSGALSTIGERRGWTSEQMWSATEAYRQTFPVAEQWRQDTISRCQEHGYVELIDGHRRTRFEAMPIWRQIFTSKFPSYDSRGVELFVGEMARAIQARAKNQAVNAVIQGGCAHLAKVSILKILERFKELGWSKREARFMAPIHDELVFSVHRDIAVQAVHEIRGLMCDHPDIFKVMKLDASPSIGKTFEPYGPKAKYGQIELYECPTLPGVSQTGRLDDQGITEVVEYLMSA